VQIHPLIFILGGLGVLTLMAKSALGFIVKNDSVIVPLTPEMRVASNVVVQVWKKYGYTPVMTSGLDGKHRKDSLHYSGYAEDWQTKDLPDNKKYLMVKEVRAALGSQYDVLLEYDGLPDEHLHIEYDPEWR
jgi:hypothetical protein